MNKILSSFSIKDLENLTGIKAHTIRMWEKRYDLLEPSRTDTNIRTYDLKSLQKLLNVTFLISAGFKISAIGKMEESDLQTTVREYASKTGDKNRFIDDLKIAMLMFDQYRFEQTYNKLLAEMSFRDIFMNVFIPLLEFIGVHWQSDSITPAHEHFVTSLIYQKLHINIERVQQPQMGKDHVYVLFLPENEIHELGLLYINYELSLAGKNTIFLGASVPMDNLKSLLEIYQKVTFISYFTLFPLKDEVNGYVKAFQKELLFNKSTELWVFGKLAQNIDKHGDQIVLFNKINELINKI